MKLWLNRFWWQLKQNFTGEMRRLSKIGPLASQSAWSKDVNRSLGQFMCVKVGVAYVIYWIWYLLFSWHVAFCTFCDKFVKFKPFTLAAWREPRLHFNLNAHVNQTWMESSDYICKWQASVHRQHGTFTKSHLSGPKYCY